MTRKRRIRVVEILSIVVVLSGCETLETQPNNAAAFAQAGVVYTSGVNPLIDAYYVSRIDSNSVNIMTAAQLLSGDAAPQLRMEALRSNNEKLVQGYATLSRIKQHNALLEQYFRTLAAFVADDSSKGINDELGSIVGQLNGLGLAAEPFTVAGKEVDPGKATPLLVEAGANAYKSVELNALLARDGQAIANELALQQVLVDTLANELRLNSENIYKRTVEAKLAEDFAKDRVNKSWRTQRIQYLTRVATIDDASRKASSTIAELMVKWNQFADGSLRPDGIEGMRELAADFVRSMKEVNEILTT